MNWKIGQKLVCVTDCNWAVGGGPKKDEVVTFNGFFTGFFSGKQMASFVEYGDENGYSPEYFRPLVGDDAKDSLISSFRVVTETSDCPMVPEIETA